MWNTRRVFHHFHAPERGGKGEVTFSLSPHRGALFGSPFPPSRPQAIPRRSGFSFCFFFFFVLEVFI